MVGEGDRWRALGEASGGTIALREDGGNRQKRAPDVPWERGVLRNTELIQSGLGLG